MIQISSREDFATRLAHFMTAQQHLSISGVRHTGESLEESTNKFLDQFEVAPTPPEIREPVGYVILKKDESPTKGVFGKQRYATKQDALNDLMRVIREDAHDWYEIVPVHR